ncbi:MAG: hypothetical protein WAL48_00925 [Xanthobacteraceae bacterium]
MVVVDVFMPGVGGLEVGPRPRPGVPLIAISGHVFVDHPFPDQFRKLALELGAARCLGKPITPSMREISAILADIRQAGPAGERSADQAK